MAKTTLRNTQADHTADCTTASRIYPQEPTIGLIACIDSSTNVAKTAHCKELSNFLLIMSQCLWNWIRVSCHWQCLQKALGPLIGSSSIFGKTITRITICFQTLLIQCMLITHKKWGSHGMAKTTLRNTDHTTTSKNLFSRTDCQAYHIALTPAPM